MHELPEGHRDGDTPQPAPTQNPCSHMPSPRDNLSPHDVPAERPVGRASGGRAAHVSPDPHSDPGAPGPTIVESERRFRSLIAATAQVFWTADPDGQMRDSPMWRAMTGQSVEEMLGLGWLRAVHPDDRPAVASAWESAIRRSATFDLEYRVRLHDGFFCWYAARGVPVTDEAGLIVEWVGTYTDIHDRKRSQELERFLLEAARQLSASLDLGATLRAVTSLALSRFADYCIVYLIEPDGTYRQVAGAHAVPEKASLLQRLGERYRPDPENPHSPVACAIGSRTPVLVPSAATGPLRPPSTDPDFIRIVGELATISYMVVPLIARDEILGAMVLAASVSGRIYDTQDLAQAELLGARAALAIDNARHFMEAQETRDRALRAAHLESQLAQARLETLRAQLNPHFLFNALNTIAMLVRRNASREAIRGVVSLSELLRKVLAGTGAAEVPLREELGVIEHYLGIEQLRFGSRLGVNIAAEPDTLDALVPSLVLQPLVENAVRHGIAQSRDGGTVEVRCRRANGSLIINVRDDCVGLAEGWDPPTSGGIGLANTRERLLRLYDRAQRFDVRNAPGGGALATIEIPFHTATP